MVNIFNLLPKPQFLSDYLIEMVNNFNLMSKHQVYIEIMIQTQEDSRLVWDASKIDKKRLLHILTTEHEHTVHVRELLSEKGGRSTVHLFGHLKTVYRI